MTPETLERGTGRGDAETPRKYTSNLSLLSVFAFLATLRLGDFASWRLGVETKFPQRRKKRRRGYA